VTEAAAVEAPIKPWAIQAPASSPPGRRSTKASRSPPPHLRKCNKPHPPLLHALTSRSGQKVRTILEQIADAANELSWDHECEPTLCSAARCGCSVNIAELLLGYRADPVAKNVRGRTPAQIMGPPTPWQKSPSATTPKVWDFTSPWETGPWSANFISDDLISASLPSPVQQSAEYAHLKALAQMALYKEEEEAVTEAAAMEAPITLRATKAPASSPIGRRSTKASQSPPPHLRKGPPSRWQKSPSATTPRLGDFMSPWAAGPWSANSTSDDFISAS